MAGGFVHIQILKTPVQILCRILWLHYSLLYTDDLALRKQGAA